MTCDRLHGSSVWNKTTQHPRHISTKPTNMVAESWAMERRCDHPTQSDLDVEVESMMGDLAETKKSLAADETLAA